MAYTLRRVCFAAPWLVVLGWILWQGIQNIEGALILFLVAGMELAAAPTSLVFVVVVSAGERVVPGDLLAWLNPSSPLGNFLIIWTLMFALSYWQWFHLIPKVFGAPRRRRHRRNQAFPGSK
jgi:hypothetical protein